MIFCVEDDSNIRELVVYTLETTGFKARGFEDGREFLEALALETPELVLMDIMLPGDDGLELLKKLKASPKTREIPVIMVTAKGAEYDKVKGLDLGADDYVTKPFGMMELVSRIKAVLRRTRKDAQEPQDIIAVGEIEINTKKHMYETVKALVDTGFEGYVRPDHGRMIWGETGKPGYGLYDRALGATYLNGLFEACEKALNAEKGESL